jgi:hypothetical protein
MTGPARIPDAGKADGGAAVPKLSDDQLQTKIRSLREASAMSTDPCLTAQVIAFSNEKVCKTFLDKFNNAEFLSKGIECMDRGTSAETKSVVFKFEPKPGAFFLVPPTFAAVVNMVDRYCVTIVDPFISPSAE